MHFQAEVHLHIGLCCLDGALISAIFSPIGFYSFDFLNFPFAPFQWDCVTWLPQLIISLHEGLFPTVGFITASPHFLIISYLFWLCFSRTAATVDGIAANGSRLALSPRKPYALSGCVIKGLTQMT